MDLSATIKALIAEREKIDRAIQMLEGLEGTKSSEGKSRRGRKSMSVEERQQVGERIRRYWASKRKDKAKG